MLSVRGLRVMRGTGPSAHRIHLPAIDLPRGGLMAITGESGCGKSTLLEALGLLLQPYEVASYRLNTTDMTDSLITNNQQALAALRAQTIGFVLQSGGLLPFLNVSENIALPRRLLGLPTQCEQVDYAVAALQLQPLLSKLPQALSIGERQRVAFVRAIAHQPRLLLADEPTAALDPHNARRLLNLIVKLAEELGIAALLVSHDWALMEEFRLPRLIAENQPGETCFVPTS